MVAQRSGTRVTVRLSAGQLACLDRFASDAGISRSLALRRLLDGASDGAVAKGRLAHHELVSLLEERARAGSAPAIRELLRRAEADAEMERLRELTT